MDLRFYTGHGAKLCPWRSAHVRLEGEHLHVFRVIAAPISGVDLPPLLLDRSQKRGRQASIPQAASSLPRHGRYDYNPRAL